MMLILFLQHMKQNWLLLGFRNMESMILYRSKEKKECKSNTEILQKQIEKCTIVEIPKYRHGELAIGNHRFVGMTGEAVSVRNGKSHIHYLDTTTDFYEDHYHNICVK